MAVVGIITVLTVLVTLTINPARQFSQARNTERRSNVATILSAIGQRMAENKGTFADAFTVGNTTYTCPPLPTTAVVIGSADGRINLSCLTPTYIGTQLPVDPNGGYWLSSTHYDTNYTVSVDDAGRVTVCAPNAAKEAYVADRVGICLSR